MKKTVWLLLLGLACAFACKREQRVPQKEEDKLLKKAEAFLYRQNDSAYYYFNKVATGSRDSLDIAIAYNYMAGIQSDAGDYFGSQETLTSSLRYLDEQRPRDRNCLASDYNELGLASFNLKEYDAALSYFDKAAALAAPDLQLTVLNNKANTYQRKQDYLNALRLYREVLNRAGAVAVVYPRILSNMAKTRWLQNKRYNAAPEMLKALGIRTKAKDVWGQNASYSHLSDYYAGTKPDSGLYYARAMYRVAQTLSSPDDQLEALEKLIRLGSIDDKKVYFERYHFLNDSLQTARNAAKNQFAFIRYDAEKNKADKLRLQKENTVKAYEINQQRMALYALVALLAGGIFWYFKRRQHLLLEADNALKKEQLRISAKIHDGIANDLYKLMTQVENGRVPEQALLADTLEDLYEQTREISYDSPEMHSYNFHEKVEDMLTAFASRGVRVNIVGNDSETWQNVSDRARREIARVVQELMVNMKKHSGADEATLRFSRDEHSLLVRYQDNGKGLSPDFAQGNGIRNTVSRIEALDGRITFANRPSGGLGVEITVPVK